VQINVDYVKERPVMGMNGRKGRARTMAKIRRSRIREAQAEGIDTNDRAAFRAWERRKLHELCDRIQRNSGKPADQWT